MIINKEALEQLHLCIDGDGNIRNPTLTTHIIGDTSPVSKILEDIDHPTSPFSRKTSDALSRRMLDGRTATSPTDE